MSLSGRRSVDGVEGCELMILAVLNMNIDGYGNSLLGLGALKCGWNFGSLKI